MRYVSKPSEIEAVHWKGDNLEEVVEFLNGEGYAYAQAGGGPGELKILAGKGGVQKMVPVPVGHWIVHQPGDLSDVWPVDPRYFANKYDPVE